jgi:hypothetical protein
MTASTRPVPTGLPACRSRLPRPQRAGSARLILGTSFAAGGSAAVAAFLHCIVPML